MGSMRSSTSRTQRQLSKDQHQHQHDQKSAMFHHPPPQGPGRQGGHQLMTSPSKPKSNPFGEAKPVDTNKKVLQVHDQVLAQKQNEQHHKNVPPVPQNFSQPPPNFRPHDINPNLVKIQRRPEGVPPAGASNGKVWMNSNIQIPPPPNPRQQQQHQQSSRPNRVNVSLRLLPAYLIIHI